MEAEKKGNDFAKLLEKCRDPVRLKVLTTGLAVVVGYVCVYMPLGGRIEETSNKLRTERKRLALATEIEFLRAQVDKFEPRLPRQTDVNEWVQYLLEGTRKFPLKLNSLDSEDPRRVGPYEAVVLQMELEGAYGDLDAFLHWIESNQRLFRVDSANIEPPRDGSRTLVMRLTLLGVKG
jgi:Tfp pilus assembly protein PilO